MNIVEHFKEKVTQWNAEQKCGFCFEFGAPLDESTLNKQQTENCCVNVFITDISMRSGYSNKEGFNGSKVLKSCFYSFNLWFLVKSDLGTNNYNEILGHSIEESKWETIFNPLLECFGCGVNVCESADNFAGYTRYGASLVHNNTSNVYDGIKVNAEVEILKD